MNDGTINKTVPADNFYLFKSCVAGSIYPGIEISIRYVLDRIGARYTDDPNHSSCTGFGVHCGAVPLSTNLAINARNFSIVSQSEDRNIICTCPTTYGNLKECKEMLSHDRSKREQTISVLEKIGRPYDISPTVHHVSEVFLKNLGIIKSRAVYSPEGIRAATHHGCHYSKIFFADVTSGSYERPTVLDDIASGLGCEVADYGERALCCGMGFHHTMIEGEYPGALLERKFSSILEAKPDLIITQCAGCSFNLDYYQEKISCRLGCELDIPVLYISELVALLLGADPYEIGLDMHAVPVEPLLEKIGIGVE